MVLCTSNFFSISSKRPFRLFSSIDSIVPGMNWIRAKKMTWSDMAETASDGSNQKCMFIHVKSVYFCIMITLFYGLSAACVLVQKSIFFAQEIFCQRILFFMLIKLTQTRKNRDWINCVRHVAVSVFFRLWMEMVRLHTRNFNEMNIEHISDGLTVECDRSKKFTKKKKKTEIESMTWNLHMELYQ